MINKEDLTDLTVDTSEESQDGPGGHCKKRETEDRPRGDQLVDFPIHNLFGKRILKKTRVQFFHKDHKGVANRSKEWDGQQGSVGW